jgi:hypothetical protein
MVVTELLTTKMAIMISSTIPTAADIDHPRMVEVGNG